MAGEAWVDPARGGVGQQAQPAEAGLALEPPAMSSGSETIS